MSFSSNTKTELCQNRTDKKCCAVAECYGVLLYCNTFSPSGGIRIITSSEDFAQRLPKLFKRAFSLSFDDIKEGKGKFSLKISNTEKLKKISAVYGEDTDETVSHHVNLAVLEDDCCRLSFLRGAFLAGGSVSDPEKSYHAEIMTSHSHVPGETAAILKDIGINPGISQRKGKNIIYIKKADMIADFFTAIGASHSSIALVSAKVDKEMSNNIMRKVNCDSANLDKQVVAASGQLEAIRKYVSENGLDALDEPLRSAALLRIGNPSLCLSDLARLSVPPVTKSCIAYRLRKIVELAQQSEEKE